MIFGLTDPLGLFVIARILFGGNGAQPLPSGPFPVSPPGTLPPWPSGWCPDLPPPPEVVARGWALMPTLWAKGQGARQVEMTGGRWISYVAELGPDGSKAVAAYRSENCEPVVPVVPSSPVAPSGPDPALQSAIVMNEALKLRGYKVTDQALYREFQSKAGLKVDGYPGTVTMLKLETVLRSAGMTIAPVRVYPWKADPAAGGYNGVNAPTMAEWMGTGAGSSPVAQAARSAPATPRSPAMQRALSNVPAPQPAPIPAVAPVPVLPTVSTDKDVQHALNVLRYKGQNGLPLTEDGKIGPQSKFAIGAFQKDHPPLVVNKIAGPKTKAALSVALASAGIAA